MYWLFCLLLGLLLGYLVQPRCEGFFLILLYFVFFGGFGCCLLEPCSFLKAGGGVDQG